VIAVLSLAGMGDSPHQPSFGENRHDFQPPPPSSAPPAPRPGAALGLADRADAQSAQPLEIVKIVTGFPPGGTSDRSAPRRREPARQRLHQAALVENKAVGAGRSPGAGHEGCATDRRRHPGDAGVDADDLSAHLQEAGGYECVCRRHPP